MKKLLWFLLLQTLIPLSAKSYGLLQDSTANALLIEQKTLYYLKHTEQCWEVVEARDQTIDSLTSITKDQQEANKLCELGTNSAVRVASSAVAKNTQLTKDLETQTKRKNGWKKYSFWSSAVAVAEAGIIYLKTRTLW